MVFQWKINRQTTQGFTPRCHREREVDNSIPRAQKFYLTEMPRRSHPRLQTHTDNEVQEMQEEARDTMRKDLEESYREETVLVERIKRMRRLQTEELRDTMGNRAGPADLRNRNRELHEVM